jgi:crotonobetainyl-CoA:carnitine CoA-transferase CaiB-like acyl-CoA transferase
MDPVPGVGEHTQAILRELGLGAEHMAALQTSNAI